jgi:hypothetical protein
MAVWGKALDFPARAGANFQGANAPPSGLQGQK